MDNLREDFKNWLVRQGISDKLINGKSSTVYEYIRQLDILSKKLYNSDDWNLLIKNATTLVFFYLLCGKAKYRNNNYTFDKLQQYIKLNKLPEIHSCILAEFAKYKSNETFLLQTLNNKTFNEKAGVSFLKFYQFMSEEKKIFNIPLQDIKDFVSQLLKILIKLKLKPVSASSPARIEMSSQGNDTRINLGGKLVANINGDDRGKIHFQNSNAKIDGNVEDVSLIFEDSHSLNNAISGNIGGLDILAINKGTLTFDKEPTDTITTVQVGNGATLDIGDKTLHSTGDKADGEGVIFADNSTLAFTVTDKDTYGKIKANYIKISENDTNLNMTLNGAALAKGETATFKLFNGADSAEAEVEGKFANLSRNSRYEFTDNGDGTFDVTSVGSATDAVVDAGGSANNAGTAEAWDSVSASTSSPVAAAVTEKLAQLSNSTNAAEQKAYVDALTAVAPEVAPMVQKTQTETANQVFGAVSTRLTGGSISTGGEGMASGDNIFKRGAMWVQGLFNKSKLDNTSKAKGFDADSNGIAFGAEKFVTDDTKVGIGYAYTNTDIDGFMRSTDVDTHTAIVYGEYKPSNWYVNGIATYGWSDYEESKNVAGVGVKADYDVETFGLQAMTGYDMNINGLGITPETGLRYVHIKQDAYKDSADQRVSANDSDILTGVIGAKISKNFELSNGMNIKPEARIAATYDLFNDDVNSVVTLANGSAYAVEGEALDRFGLEFGAGVTAEVNDKVELSFGYEGKFREDYQDHTGLINAKYKF